jgi:hypothetical protein
MKGEGRGPIHASEQKSGFCYLYNLQLCLWWRAATLQVTGPAHWPWSRRGWEGS